MTDMYSDQPVEEPQTVPTPHTDLADKIQLRLAGLIRREDGLYDVELEKRIDTRTLKGREFWNRMGHHLGRMKDDLVAIHQLLLEIKT